MTDELTLDDLPQPEEETTVSPDNLEVDGDNPNSQTDEMFGLLCDNMRKRGWIGNDIVADTDGLIADGEHRWRAAQEIGLTEVPVKLYDITDEERRLWRQELNKISGEHDSKRDALEYDYLLDNGMSDEVQSLTRAAGEDLDDLLEEIKLQGDRPAQYEYDPEHNVYFEDCIEGMRERLDDNSVDMVFTSPPYNVDIEYGEYDDDQTMEEYRQFLTDVFAELARVVKDDGHIFINHQHSYQDGKVHRNGWMDDLMPLPLRSYIIWAKEKGIKTSLSGLNGNGSFVPIWEFILHFSEDPRPLDNTPQYGLWEINSLSGRDSGEHPAAYPVELPQKALEAATDQGDLILDPFMGSGTTAVAAIQNDRDYIGFELDAENYRPVIERRISEAKRAKESSVNRDDADTDADTDPTNAEADD